MLDLKKLLKTTSKYQKILNDNEIFSLKDFLEYFPRTYEDRTNIKNIKDINTDNKTVSSIKAQIIEKKLLPRKGRKIYEITIQDPLGTIAYIHFFNSYYQYKSLEQNERYIITGKASFRYGKISFTHPEYSKAQAQEKDSPSQKNKEKNNYNIARIYPIYPELSGIKSNRFAKKMRIAKDYIDELFIEYFPEDFLKKFGLMELSSSIKNIHYPETMEKQEQAIRRIFFERLLRIQLISLLNKQYYQQTKSNNTNRVEIQWEIVKYFLQKLPFQLTQAQKKSLKNIIEEIHQEEAMMKLLQGDVGSGKTIVATTAIYYIQQVFKGQSVLIAPLEILASQHYKNLSKLLLPLGLRTELLTGSTTKSQKDKIKQAIKQGKIDVVIGTHAILQEDVGFKNLHLAIIDEQHKFGVRQRAFLKKFGSPHILQMSATPIPRSMALAFFGEFSVSIIDELPKGRKTIQTKIISQAEGNKLKPRILDKIKKGEQVFVVTPLIEESDKLENTSSTLSEYENIKELFSEIKDQIGLIHGKIKTEKKEKIMQEFKTGKIKILVSTTVIEVGVDIPQATIMIIKNAERFGLSQLHQLRGRIGRSDLQAYCFLETQKKSSDAYKRLKAMEEITDGFKLAELDLQNRGAGEILGTKQAGDTDIPLSILSDIRFLEQVQDAAKRLLQKYPKLEGLQGFNTIQEISQGNIGDILA